MATLLSHLSERELVGMVSDDVRSAMQARQDIDEFKLRQYELYRIWRRDMNSGGRSGQGPGGWSRSTLPMAFWTIETKLSRMGTNPPGVVAKAANPAAEAYEHEKTMRLQYHFARARLESEVVHGLKNMLVLGDGPMKTRWDHGLGGPVAEAIPWWDFYVSPNALRLHTAEAHFHRTWWTKRAIEGFVREQRKLGRDSLWDLNAFEAMKSQAAERSQFDAISSQLALINRRVASPGFTDDGTMVPVWEVHYRGGGTVWVGGVDADILLRLHREPITHTREFVPYRPFWRFENTPDLLGGSLHPIADTEMLESSQTEMSALVNLYIDQAAANVNAPVVFDPNRIEAAVLKHGLSTPGGLIPTKGGLAEGAVERMFPGRVSGDVPDAITLMRDIGALTSGASEFSAGNTSAAGISGQTATGLSIITSESNHRFAFLQSRAAASLRDFAHQVDWMDRQFSLRSLAVRRDDAGRISQAGPLGAVERDEQFVEIGTASNDRSREYEIEVDVGQMEDADNAADIQRAERMLAGLQGFAAMAPDTLGLINWRQLMREYFAAYGQDPDKMVRESPAQAGPAALGSGETPGEMMVDPGGQVIPFNGSNQLPGATSASPTTIEQPLQ